MNIIFNTLFLLLSILINNTLSSITTYSDVRINYDKTKEIVQNCLNEVLNTLNLNDQVKKRPKVQLLLIIHENLNNVVQHKWKVTFDIKNMVRAENYTSPKQVYEFVDEAITAMKTDNLSNDTETNAIQRNLNTSKSTDFFSDLFTRINKQSIATEDTSYQKSDGNLDKNDRDYEDEIERRVNFVIQTWQPKEPHNEARRVYGGKPVGISQFPFIASVHVLGKFSCSGSIISSNFVITAASCLQPGRMYKANQRPIEVRIGSEHAKIGGELLPALEVIFHPHYDPVNLVNNLAMIKVLLAHYVMAGQQKAINRPMIKKIRMDSWPKNLPKDIDAKEVLILGWGDGEHVTSTKNNQHLTSAFLDLQSFGDCIDIYTQQYVTDKNFCAGLVYKGSGACNGDIGGPAIVLGILVGIVSFGPPACGTVSDPTVFTKLGYYTSWINDVINERIPKSRLSDRLWLSDTSLFSQLNPVLQNSHEELIILRELVDELDKPGNKISKIIEEDQELDDEMKIIFQTTTTPVDTAHHELVNKSVILIPGIHVPEETTIPPMLADKESVNIIDIGLPNVIPYDKLGGLYGNVVADSTELRYYVNQYLTHGTLFKAKNIPDPKQADITSIETNENFEYESSEGLSIEVPPGGFLQENKDLNIKMRPKGLKVKSVKEERAVFDLGEEDHVFNIGNVPKVPAKDIWFDVIRLRQSQQRKGVTRLRNIVNNILARNGDFAKQLRSLYLSKLGF